jgi:hypothetical protein
LAADGWADSEHPEQSIRGEKVVVEAGSLLVASNAVCGINPEVEERVASVAASLVPYARGERVRARVCLEPALALDHAAAHLCLSSIGLPDHDLDRLLQESLRAEAAGSRERPPHRELEQEWLRRLARLGIAEPRREAGLSRRSAVARNIDLLPPNTDDVYAFTHALMYLTDFGARRPRLPCAAGDIEARAAALLADSLDVEDYDLAGEILLTWPFLRRPWCADGALGFSFLAAVEDRARILPGPGISPERLQALEGERRRQYALAASYHTAFVMGLLCAAALRPGRLPPLLSALPCDSASVQASRELLILLGADDPVRFWQRFLIAQPDTTLGAAAPLVFNICLCRAARRRDPELLRETLLAGQRHGLLDRPAARQAGQLLRRCSLLAGEPRRRDDRPAVGFVAPSASRSSGSRRVSAHLEVRRF